MRNQVQLIGNVGKAPEVTATTKDQKPVVRFAIAQDVSGMDPATQKIVKKEPQWFQVCCFGGLAERVLSSLAKGDLVIISGEVKSRSYQAEGGEKRTSYEVVAHEIFKLERLRKQKEQAGVEGDSPDFGNDFDSNGLGVFLT